MTDGMCPICRGTAEITSLLPHEDAVIIGCGNCGFLKLFAMDRPYFEKLSDRSLLPYLSAYIRQNSTRKNPVVLSDDWQSLAGSHKATTVPQKINRLLSLIAQRTDFPGAQVTFFGSDQPLIDAANDRELAYLLKQIKELGYIELQRTQEGLLECVMKAGGWERLQEQTVAGIPGRCFVAMSFDSSLNESWIKGIRPALQEDCKLDPIRMDAIEHNDKICDKIIAEIRLSQFLVADFTLHRGGVYFEAGFALGLGRPVIWMCREDELPRAHFDTRQYNHIVWTTPDDLRTKLRDRVVATIPGVSANQSVSPAHSASA